MTYVLRFDDPRADDVSLVGGKGANLGRLTAAGFPVPAGFTVPTGGYAAFIAAGDFKAEIAGIVESIDFDDVESVEKRSAEIRDLIADAECPAAVATQLRAAYQELGADILTAVRSSGTAEDLKEASFAGQHDTYLHIRGADCVIDAVKRCWASLWTARAMSYREHKGFDHDSVGIAVVVQAMVDAEVSGVMFTANPIKAATDEIRINASWGLGEAIVSGLVTPDDFTLHAGTLRVVDKTLGAKERRIRLNHEVGHGTVTEAVLQAQREVFSLSDERAAELADLGRQVMAHYDGLPQDIEWAFSGGQFHLLQTRPVTGAHFSWDETIADWHSRGDEEYDTFWSRAWSDEGWTGAVTPLFFSTRSLGFHRGHVYANRLWGFEDSARRQQHKYYRGTVYWNTALDRNFVERMAPPKFRSLALNFVSPLEHEDILNAPFSYKRMLRVLARVEALAPEQGFTRWLKLEHDYVDNRRAEAAGKSDDELRRLSDEALVDYTETRVDFEAQYIQDIHIGWFLHGGIYMTLLNQIVDRWYDGPNTGAVTDLLTGAEQRTYTVKESLGLWDLASRIRASVHLTDLFRAHPGGDFFTRLPESEEGRAFLACYQEFVAEYGPRGHADRDIYFTRRVEDPAVDYRLLSTMLEVDEGYDPLAVEEAANRRKQAAYESIVSNLRRKRFGALRARIFKLVNRYNQELLVIRDDQRGFVDISTYTIKRCFKEINRRIIERGLLEEDRDFYFLGRHELYAVLFGRANPTLTTAKIAGRKHHFDLLNAKEVENPKYLHRNQAVVLADERDDGPTLKGIPTSGGVASGTARVVKSLEMISSVRKGEILICNSTDPGWTPVFLLLAGAVFETGGAFAHCSCLSREYGIPAVQVTGALRRIPDGATVTVDGNTGTVTVLETS